MASEFRPELVFGYFEVLSEFWDGVSVSVVLSYSVVEDGLPDKPCSFAIWLNH